MKELENKGITITELFKDDYICLAMCAAVWAFWSHKSLEPIVKNLGCCVSIVQIAVLIIMAATNNFTFDRALLCCAVILGLHILLSLASWLISAFMSSFIVSYGKCYLVDIAVSELPCQTIGLPEITEDTGMSTVLLKLREKRYSLSLASVKKLAGESSHVEE